MQNKKAQISDTMVWLVATIVIIVILSISIFITSTKFVGNKEIQPLVRETVAEKSMFSYLATEVDSGISGGREIIFKQLQINNIEGDNGDLAAEIFKEDYWADYSVGVWIGINFNGIGIRKNSYFGSRLVSILGKNNDKISPYVVEKINLNKDGRYLEGMFVDV